MKKVAVVLCGSGFLDGSEIRESVGVLWALSQHKDVEVQCFAPDRTQADVVNTLTQQPASGEKRNMLVEAARIARSQIKPLTELDPNKYNALVIPGGFGVAKNLCDFATKGSLGIPLNDMRNIATEFHIQKKPIGAICIAPALIALCLKSEKLELTVGEAGGAATEIEKLGHKHIVKKPNEIHVDLKHKVVSTPAYMYDSAPLHLIFEGIKKLVDEVVKLA